MEFIASLSEWGYIGLFLAAFLAGSIIPLSSEAILGVLLMANYNMWGCIIAATAGNWLGGLSCYYLGYLGRMEWIEKYMRIKREKLEKMQHFLQGKGALMAFFVFVPVVGDVMIVAFGLMRANIYFVGLSMLVGKLLRYVVVGYGMDSIISYFF